MVPREGRAGLWLGGLIAPVLWSGVLLYSIMELLKSLAREAAINWIWFMGSQISLRHRRPASSVLRQAACSQLARNLPFVCTRRKLKLPEQFRREQAGRKRS